MKARRTGGKRVETTERDPLTPPPQLRVSRLRLGTDEVVVLDYPLDVATTDPLSELTPGQREVAALLLAGRSNTQIAAARGTAPSTVAKQIEHVYRRMGVGSRAELAAALLRGKR